MKEFNTALIREKVVFRSRPADGAAMGDDMANVGSNRIMVQLGAEDVVVRAQNMHTALRLAASLVSFYASHDGGVALALNEEKDWKSLWAKALSSYERENNDRIWGSVHIGGKPAFATSPHPFVDVIEKCVAAAAGNYDAAIDLTEAALKKAGQDVKIEHAVNAAANFTDNGKSMRCGILHRSVKTGIFTFTVEGGETMDRTYRTLSIAADFLEMINLQFLYRPLGSKLRSEEISPYSPEGKKARAIGERHGELMRHTVAFEAAYTVRYRPEKPELKLA